MNAPEFIKFPKMARLSREIIITEKLDGTNAQVYVGEDGQVLAASRTRWITPSDDNFGFALWVSQHEEELRMLGPGRHYGEWWGCGIQRGYGLSERRFSLFNVSRWGAVRPECCHVVPELFRGMFDSQSVRNVMEVLAGNGSAAAPGYKNPEGIIVYHVAGNVAFKKTLQDDEKGKPE